MLTHIKMLPVLCSAVLALALVTAPYKVTFENHFLELHTQTAWGKDGGKGEMATAGGGNNGSKGWRECRRQCAGTKAMVAASKVAAGGGNSGDNGGKSNSAGNSGNVQSGKVNQSTPAESVAIDGATMEVRHWNGMSERIKDGRYVMKDAKGRTIINRTATTADQSRLRSFDR